jgi:hypothetical protein
VTSLPRARPRILSPFAFRLSPYDYGMARLFETGSGFVVSYPAWTILLALAGIALFVYAGRPKAKVAKRWAVLVVAALLTWAGTYFFTFKATLTAESGRVYGFLRHDARIDWGDAAAAVVEERSGKGGPNYFLVVAKRSGGAFEMPLSGLNDGERERVVAFVRARMPK